MPTEYVYPTAVQLQQIAQELVPRLTAVRPCFEIFPIREVDAHLRKGAAPALAP